MHRVAASTPPSAAHGCSLRHLALQVARFLSTALVHGSEAAPRRHVDAHAAGAAAADYGLLRGVFSPVELLRRPQPTLYLPCISPVSPLYPPYISELLRRPQLHRYAAYLEAQGAQPPSGAPAGESAAERVEETEGRAVAGAGARAGAQEAHEAGAAQAETQDAAAEEAEEAEEAEAAEEAEEVALLSRLQGEVSLDGAAPELLQRTLALAARHSHAALATCAIGMGAAARARCERDGTRPSC